MIRCLYFPLRYVRVQVRVRIRVGVGVELGYVWVGWLVGLARQKPLFKLKIHQKS